MKQKIIDILQYYTKEMEGYDYLGTNPGVSVSDYENIANEIIESLKEGNNP